MKFIPPLKPGTFRRRYKRFFAEVDGDGQILTCHVPNTGSLKGCLNQGAPCLFSVSSDPNRKLPYTLQMVQDGGAWVGVNTTLANAIVWEAWKAGEIPSWLSYDGGQKEVRLHSQTRLDLAMWKGCQEVPAGEKLTLEHVKKHKFHFVEIKSVTMAAGGVAMFPDAVTERGQKHLQEMMALIAHGHTAELVFLVQRNDCRKFSPADHIDPKYGILLRQAILEGVKVTAFPCDLDPAGIRLIPKPLTLEI